MTLALAIVAGYRMRIRQLKQRFDLVLNERSRIARELHDTLLQGLSGITMQLQALWTKLPPSRERHLLADIISDAGRCSAEARQWLWGLRTIGPGSLPFSEKLARLAGHAVSGSGVSLGLQLAPVSLSAFPEIEYQLLRIAQEAISNTLAHARAKHLDIRLETDGRALKLELKDDGVGFSSSQPVLQGHFGMEGMRERATEIGAELTIASAPGQGTRIAIRVPLRPANSAGSNAEHPFEHQLR